MKAHCRIVAHPGQVSLHRARRRRPSSGRSFSTARFRSCNACKTLTKGLGHVRGLQRDVTTLRAQSSALRVLRGHRAGAPGAPRPRRCRPGLACPTFLHTALGVQSAVRGQYTFPFSRGGLGASVTAVRQAFQIVVGAGVMVRSVGAHPAHYVGSYRGHRVGASTPAQLVDNVLRAERSVRTSGFDAR